MPEKKEKAAPEQEYLAQVAELSSKIQQLIEITFSLGFLEGKVNFGPDINLNQSDLEPEVKRFLILSKIEQFRPSLYLVLSSPRPEVNLLSLYFSTQGSEGAPAYLAICTIAAKDESSANVYLGLNESKSRALSVEAQRINSTLIKPATPTSRALFINLEKHLKIAKSVVAFAERKVEQLMPPTLH